MLGGGFKAERLRVNLRLVINRLKLLEKKKSKSWWLTKTLVLLSDCLCGFSGFLFARRAFNFSVAPCNDKQCTLSHSHSQIWHEAELAQKARKEIADYLSSGKDERARIRVEHIIREDYLVEAMEILELYCDLLLARFGLIQTMK